MLQFRPIQQLLTTNRNGKLEWPRSGCNWSVQIETEVSRKTHEKCSRKTPFKKVKMLTVIKNKNNNNNMTTITTIMQNQFEQQVQLCLGLGHGRRKTQSVSTVVRIPHGLTQ